MFVCSYSWGKSWHQNWLAAKFLSPICHLTLRAQLYVNAMSPRMPASEGKTTGHFAMICFSCQGSGQPWLMDGCLAVGNVSMGPLRKYARAVFSGWHLALDSKKHGTSRVEFCFSWKSRVLKTCFVSPSLSFANKTSHPLWQWTLLMFFPLFPWFAALGRTEWNVQLSVSFLKGGLVFLEKRPQWAWPRPGICVKWTKDLVGCQLRQNFK